jgi:hypothetical protein
MACAVSIYEFQEVTITAQLAVFIRGVNEDFQLLEGFL